MLDSLFPVFVQHIDELEESSKKWSVVYEDKDEDTNIPYRRIGDKCFPIDQIDMEGNFIGKKKDWWLNTYYYDKYCYILEEWCFIYIGVYFGNQRYEYSDMKKLLQGIIKLNNDYSDIAKTYLDKLNAIKDKADEINTEIRKVVKRNTSKTIK